MICQICKQEMPFKKRNGEYYFEAVEALAKVPKEDGVGFLALCPTCAAKYKEFVKRVAEAENHIEQQLLDASNSFEIPIQLGDERTSLRLVETHLLDLQVLLQETTRDDVDAGE